MWSKYVVQNRMVFAPRRDWVCHFGISLSKKVTSVFTSLPEPPLYPLQQARRGTPHSLSPLAPFVWGRVARGADESQVDQIVTKILFALKTSRGNNAHGSTPLKSPIQAPVLDCFGDVFRANRLIAAQVGNRAAHL